MSAVGLPCDGDGICMACKKKSPEEEAVVCHTCRTPWHVPCLSKPPESMASVASWVCPDCALPASDFPATIADKAQTEQEKRRKRQELWGGGAPVLDGEEEGAKRKKQRGSDVSDLIDEDLICAICMQLLDRPVTTTCGHNFCLKCFQKWVGQSKYTCAKCRAQIPRSMASLPRINLVLVLGIREAKAKKTFSDGPAHVVHYIRNEDRPVEAFRTERAKKAGKANACSGQILVTIPPDHFGPITKEYTKSGEGVCVGSTWVDRMQCRQWGIHFPHVAGIAGQSDYGAQSVALSGGYEDDEDHGEWFLYTGSGGRDLSGNKRTSKEQSFDQKFEKLNQALRVSCQKGYPVRVVRSHKEKRSFYAPENGYRYDGIYRIEMCWRKVGIQGFKVCRYLFVRCDNDPAPWTSDTLGDRPRPLPNVAELKKATDITTRKGTPAWDYDECDGWKWVKPPPASRKLSDIQDPDGRKRGRRTVRHGHSSVRDRLFKEFSCSLCKDILKLPLTTPCAHNFCKTCLLGEFDGVAAVRERTGGGRTLRMQKVIRKCPSCSNDISDFLENPQVNRQMSDLIELLQHKAKEENDNGTTVDVEAADGDSEINAANSEEGTDVESQHEGLSVSND